LEHPNIIRLLDYGERDDLAYLATEYKSGGTLREYLNNSPHGLDTEEAIQLFTYIASAVDYAHVNGVIHRDLKPENIILQKTGEAIFPYIADFGLALVEGATRYTRVDTGFPLGTDAYIAPELYEPKSQTTPQVDIYALGVMLYEALEGRSPFSLEAPPREIMNAKLNRPVPYPQNIRQRANRRVVAVIQKAMHKTPRRRYISASELMEEMDKAYRAGTEEEVARQDRKRNQNIALALLIVGLLTCFATLLAPLIPQLSLFGEDGRVFDDQMTLLPTPSLMTELTNSTLESVPPYIERPSSTLPPTMTPSFVTTVPPTLTRTERPTITLVPTAQGLGGVLRDGPLDVALVNYEFRSENHPEPAAIQFEIEFENTSNTPVDIHLNTETIHGFDNMGTRYGDFVTVFRDYWDRRCISLVGRPDFEGNFNHTLRIEAGNSSTWVWWLNPEGTQGCSQEDQIGRVRFAVDWVEFEMTVEYRIGTERETLPVKWRMIRSTS
jgi:serine/threonine protein kinase